MEFSTHSSLQTANQIDEGDQNIDETKHKTR